MLLRIQSLSTLQHSLLFQFLLEVHAQSFCDEDREVVEVLYGHHEEVEVVLCDHHAEVEVVYRPLEVHCEEVLVDVEEVVHQILVRDQETLAVEILAGRDEVEEVVGNHALPAHGGNLEEGHRGVVVGLGSHARLVRGGNLVEGLHDDVVDVVYHLQIRGQGEEVDVGDRLRSHGEVSWMVYRDDQVHDGVVVEDICKLAMDGDVGLRECDFLEVPKSRFCDVHVEEVLASGALVVFGGYPRYGRTHHH